MPFDPKQLRSFIAVVDRKTVDHCYSLIEDATSKGAKLLVGGETTQNVVMPAHLVDKVTPDIKLFRDESFGPVVGIARARDEAHAIELANDTEYGLSSAVFIRDTARGLKVARQIQAGIGLRPLRRQGRYRRFHRAALDHLRNRAGPLSDLR